MSSQYVEKIQRQAVITKSNLQRSLMRLPLRDKLRATDSEHRSLKDALNVYADEVNLVNFTSLSSLRKSLETKGYIGIKKIRIVFKRHGIFLEHGAPPKTRKGKAIKITPRKPFKWLSVVLPHEVEIFEKIVAEEYGGMIAHGMRLLIPGIFDSRSGENANKFLL